MSPDAVPTMLQRSRVPAIVTTRRSPGRAELELERDRRAGGRAADEDPLVGAAEQVADDLTSRPLDELEREGAQRSREVEGESPGAAWARRIGRVVPAARVGGLEAVGENPARTGGVSGRGAEDPRRTPGRRRWPAPGQSHFGSKAAWSPPHGSLRTTPVPSIDRRSGTLQSRRRSRATSHGHGARRLRSDSQADSPAAQGRESGWHLLAVVANLHASRNRIQSSRAGASRSRDQRTSSWNRTGAAATKPLPNTGRETTNGRSALTVFALRSKPAHGARRATRGEAHFLRESRSESGTKYACLAMRLV